MNPVDLISKQREKQKELGRFEFIPTISNDQW